MRHPPIVAVTPSMSSLFVLVRNYSPLLTKRDPLRPAALLGVSARPATRHPPADNNATRMASENIRLTPLRRG